MPQTGGDTEVRTNSRAVAEPSWEADRKSNRGAPAMDRGLRRVALECMGVELAPGPAALARVRPLALHKTPRFATPATR